MANAHHVNAAARSARRWYIAAIAALIVGVLPFAVYAAVNLADMNRQSAEVARVDETTAAWPSATRKTQLETAEEYNRDLAASGQPVIGGVATDGSDDDFSGSSDERYTHTLDAMDGIMGTVEIPSISVRLPIRHGSAADVLARGAGHLYGTSLPVGGPDTRAVITAHRGVPDKLLFTRLNELRHGDVFYVTTLGRTMAYKVVDTRTVGPDDIGAVRIEKGRDLVTLLTCTPYDVNTERLLVTGERAAMPGEAPEKADAPIDWRIRLVIGAAVFVTLIVTYMIWPRRKTCKES